MAGPWEDRPGAVVTTVMIELAYKLRKCVE